MFEKSLQKKVIHTGFTIPQMRVIEVVVSHPGASIKDISENLQMTQSTVSGIVERLISKNVLMKKSNSEDKRFVQIYATDTVTRFLETNRMEYVNESVVRALSLLQPNERAVVVEGIRLLVSAVDEAVKTEMG